MTILEKAAFMPSISKPKRCSGYVTVTPLNPVILHRIYRSANGKEQLIFTSDAHGIYALNPENGTGVVESGPKALTNAVHFSPVLVKGKILGTLRSVVEANSLVAVTPSNLRKGQPKLSTQSVRLHLMFPHLLPTKAFYIMSTTKELRPVWTLMMEKPSGWSDWTLTSAL